MSKWINKVSLLEYVDEVVAVKIMQKVSSLKGLKTKSFMALSVRDHLIPQIHFKMDELVVAQSKFCETVPDRYKKVNVSFLKTITSISGKINKKEND